MRILVSATQPEPTRLTQLLRAAFPAPSAVDQLQTVELHPTSDCAALAQVLLEPFRPNGDSFETHETIPDWVVMTSPGGIAVVMSELRRLGLTPAHARLLRFAVVGDATADALREQGLEPTYISGHTSAGADSGRVGGGAASGSSARQSIGARGLAEGLAASGLTAGATVHVLQSNRADSTIWAALQAKCGRLRRWVAYRSDFLPNSALPAAESFRRGEFAAAAFTSGSTVEGLFAAIAATQATDVAARLNAMQVFSIGPTATKALRAFGANGQSGVIEAPEATVTALAQTMRDRLLRGA